MLKFFVFKVAVKQRTLHHFYFLTAASVRTKWPKSHSYSSHCCLTRQPPCFAFALQLPTFCLHCRLMHRQASRSQCETVKHFHNCIEVLLQFRIPYCTNLRQYSNWGRNEPMRMTMHRYQTYNFRFQLLRQKIVWAYNIAAVCCNNHVQENMLISNSFTSRQGKTISRLSEIRMSFQNFRVSFWHPKTA